MLCPPFNSPRKRSRRNAGKPAPSARGGHGTGVTGATWGWGREQGAAALLGWARGEGPQQLVVPRLRPHHPKPHVLSRGGQKG